MQARTKESLVDSFDHLSPFSNSMVCKSWPGPFATVTDSQTHDVVTDWRQAAITQQEKLHVLAGLRYIQGNFPGETAFRTLGASSVFPCYRDFNALLVSQSNL